ncbi:MAG TPA: DUF4163 domain-containing protein [Beijerinckiaceae bacterium]|nr:DUF4163 domain-containing protein [Beijerinckiaceae bacterium]
MRRCVLALAGLIALGSSAWSADYDKTETSPLYQLRLRVPAAAMAIPALRDKIMALYKANADQTKSDAKDDKDSDLEFHPYDVETTWRITFESDALISLSGDTYADTGGAHPDDGFETLVWDKIANRALAITDLFAPSAAKAALASISNAATQNWNAIYRQRSGQKPGPDADQAKDGIGPDAEKLKTYALTFAKGQGSANGIVLLYGAGQVWPHVLGDFRVPVPAAAFSQYLAAQWKPTFAPGPQ